MFKNFLLVGVVTLMTSIWTRFALLLALAALVSGCAQPGSGQIEGDVFDPYEANNRQTHELNRALDKVLVRPVGVGYTTIVPDDLEASIGNFASNLSLPSTIVNNLLQGNVEGAFRNSSLQGAYLIIAARALGLDCGPMSGFDNDAVDKAFFADQPRHRSNFICAIGYGDRESIFARSPRPDFDKFNRID